MTFDYNQATEQRAFDVIEDRTEAVVQLNIHPGNAGEGGWLTRSKDGQSEGLDCELTVVEGPHTKKKFWVRLTLDGQSDGHKQAGSISRGVLRAILESARGIKPADISEAAKKARVAEYADFDGIRFMCRVGVEPAKGEFRAKNFLAEVITPDKKDWHPIEQVAAPRPTSGNGNANANAIVKPQWAHG